MRFEDHTASCRCRYCVEPHDSSTEETITLTLRKGTREWAMAQNLAGKRVVIQDARREFFDPCDYDCPDEGWALYTPPPEPITVQPGTWRWAVLMEADGKAVKRKADIGPRNPRGAFDCDRAATDWEVCE